MLAYDSLKLPKEHKLLYRIPIKQRNFIIKTLISLGIIKRYGHAILTVYDKHGNLKAKGEGYNVIVDSGKGGLGDLMLGVTTNTLNNINIGTSDADPNDTTKTDLVSPATPVERRAIVSGGRFRTNLLLTFSVLIPTSSYTRPVTAKEMGVYFDPNTTGKMFARAVITPVTLNAGDSGRADYEIQL